jgi:hypothetical protein
MNVSGVVTSGNQCQVFAKSLKTSPAQSAASANSVATIPIRIAPARIAPRVRNCVDRGPRARSNARYRDGVQRLDGKRRLNRPAIGLF